MTLETIHSVWNECNVILQNPYDEILGMTKESVIYRFQTNMPTRFEVPKKGRDVLSAFFVEIDDKTGKAVRQKRVLINEDNPFKG